MIDIAIVVKSYKNDKRRVARLLDSIDRFNRSNIPTYLIVPKTDHQDFVEFDSRSSVTLIHDEDILSLTLVESKSQRFDLPSNIMQQVTKSEFWRLNLAKNYVIIDSDSYFIKEFSKSDFLWKEDLPYTIMNEGRHQREWAARAGRSKFLLQYDELREKSKKIFGRIGPNFDFAPTPIICSSKVWEQLTLKMGKRDGKSFYDLIVDFPCETQWYGEFLLHDMTIPIVPREPLFKVWGFKEQWEEGQSIGETDDVLRENYLGVVSQSNWDSEMDSLSKAEKKKLKWEKRLRRWTKYFKGSK